MRYPVEGGCYERGLSCKKCGKLVPVRVPEGCLRVYMFWKIICWDCENAKKKEAD